MGQKFDKLLDLDKGMGMNFSYKYGYEIAKLIPVPPCCHPYLGPYLNKRNCNKLVY